jgi:outer membrane protein assembly factor BamB
MSETFTPQMRKHLWTLQHYMHALDTGDLATLAAVLSEAEHDPALERLLLETNEVYLAEDHLAMSQEEVASTLAAIGEAAETGLRQDQISTFSPVRETSHLFLQRVSQEEEKERMMDNPNVFTPTLASQPAPERLSKRRARRTWLQMFAAIVTVCVLIGGFLVVFANHRNPSTIVGSHPANSTTVPASLNLLITSYVEQKTHSVKIAARRADNGIIVWSYDTRVITQGFVPFTQVTVQNQVAYVTTNDQVYALHAQSGQLIWHTDLHLGQIQSVGGPIGSITYDYGMIYLAKNNQLYALTAQHGALTWHHSIGTNLAFTASNGIVYVEVSSNDVYTPGSVVALHSSNGSQLWSYTTADPISLMVADNALYMLLTHQQKPSDQGGNKQNKSLTAINATNGHFLWSTGVEDDGPDALVSSPGLVLFYRTTFTQAQFCAYRSSDGFQVWCTSSYQGPRDMDTSHYQVVNGTLFATYADESLNQTAEAINLSNGLVLWSKSLSVEIPTVISTASHGILYYAEGNDIVALRASDGHLLWHISENGPLSSITTDA